MAREAAGSPHCSRLRLPSRPSPSGDGDGRSEGLLTIPDPVEVVSARGSYRNIIIYSIHLLNQEQNALEEEIYELHTTFHQPGIRQASVQGG